MSSSDGQTVVNSRPISIPSTSFTESSSAASGPSPASSKCPWANVPSPPTQESNFTSIMSEQLAGKLQAEEEQKLFDEVLNDKPLFDVDVPTLEAIAVSSDDCSSDTIIAQMLQMQFNKEYDENLKRAEQKFNGSSKVSVSYSNYLVTPTEDSDSDEDYDYEPKAWDLFEKHQKAFPAMSKCGYVRVNNEVVTKHDVTMAGRRNACRVMELPPGISTGDGAAFDMQLPNQVYNTLKVYSKAEEDRRSRVHDKVEKSTNEMAIDAKTRLVLYKLVNNSILDKVYGIISTGKEAVVLYATGGRLEDTAENTTEIPDECVIKVFKTTLNEFKTRDKYIRDDYRFKDRFSKQNPRKVIHLWAEKEMHNLNRMNKVGIPCPTVVMLKKHILIMSFIGTHGQAAPMLKEVKFSQDKDEDMELLHSAYNQTISGMQKLYKECNLIHGDLSEFNILWHENKCYFIDVSQSVEPCHPHGLEFLYRDCTNICNYFGKKGVKDVKSPESLFTYISGFSLDKTGAEILNQIRDYERDLELLTFSKEEKEYPFNYCWEKTQH